MSFDGYRGKRVLVTGHTGFKGAWLTLWLRQMGAEVIGISLPPRECSLVETAGIRPNHEFILDIREGEQLKEAVVSAQPDIVFHLAAQALVLDSYEDPIGTLTTNVVGVANLLEAVRILENDCRVVVVTSDKCYHNREWEYSYRERDHLGGKDVYSASKAAAEIVSFAWSHSFLEEEGKFVCTGRGGNVIGGGDFSGNRLVPDCMRSIHEQRVIEVRNPFAIRPWQHVLDCLSGYLTLGDWMMRSDEFDGSCTAFNFGPASESQQSVRKVVEALIENWKGEWKDVSAVDVPHEAGRLAVSIEKAAVHLGWRPTWEFSRAIEATVAWYRAFYDNATPDAMRGMMLGQIESYSNAFSPGKL
jgi:CDP-glucose 4,6-dehydratase